MEVCDDDVYNRKYVMIGQLKKLLRCFSNTESFYNIVGYLNVTAVVTIDVRFGI